MKDIQGLIDFFQAELREVYRASRQGRQDQARWYRLEGMIHAAQRLDVLSQADTRQMIDEAHQEIYGCSRDQRRHKQQQLAALREQDPDKYYDTPAYERLR